MLLARAGPPPNPHDLTLMYWRGLKQTIRDQSQVDPRTGKFWDSFEALAQHTVTIDSQRVPEGIHPTSGEKDRKGGKWKPHLKPKQPTLKAASAKPSSSPHSQGQKGGAKKRPGSTPGLVNNQRDKPGPPCSGCNVPYQGPDFCKWVHVPTCKALENALAKRNAKSKNGTN